MAISFQVDEENTTKVPNKKALPGFSAQGLIVSG